MELIIDLTAADAYMALRINSAAWDELSDEDKTKHLTTGQNQLEICYELDSEAQTHKNSVVEQALFLAQTGFGADQRNALQAMNVYETAVTDEKYSLNRGIAICAYAKKALESVLRAEQKTYVRSFRLERDDSNYGTD